MQNIIIMKKHTKQIIKKFFLAGLIYASFMAGYDYFNKEAFNIMYFIINAFFFGSVIATVEYFKLKKQN